MKRLLWISVALLSVVTARAQVITEYAVREAGTVLEPYQCDSVDVRGGKYARSQMLDHTNVATDLNAFPYETISTDTTGVLTLARKEGENVVYVVSTKLRADRFMKGQLKITSPQRFAASIEGLGNVKKTEVEDSVAGKSTKSITLRMEPEREYMLTVKLFGFADEKADFSLCCKVENDEKFKDVTCTTGMAQKARFMLDNTVYNNRVTGVSISPSGKFVTLKYTYGKNASRSRSCTELWDVKSGKMISLIADGLRWMPKTDKLYYVRQGDLVTVDPLTRQEEVLYRGLPQSDFRWLPNEDGFLFSNREQGETDKGPLKHILSPRDRIPGNRGSSNVNLHHLQSGLSERLTFSKHSVYVSDVAPDGSRLLLSYYIEDVTRHPYSFSTLLEFDLATRTADTLFTDMPYVGGASYSPDGKQLLLTGGPESFDGIGKNCGSLPIANDYDKQAFIMDLNTREVEPITKDFDPSIESIEWNRADGNIYMRVTEADEVSVYCYAPKTKTMKKLALETAVTSAFDLPSENASVAVYTGQDDSHAGAAYLYNMKKGTSQLLADPMKEELDAIELGETNEWSFTSVDGTTITGRYCLPPAFDETKTYPMIVYYYGGTTPTSKGCLNYYCAQLLASRGYVVYIIQPSGTIGFGQEFSARHVNAWGKWTADDIIEGVKQFCAAHPFVDAAHVGCLGASYGGFMTQYLQTQTDIFACAISHAGISNVTSYWGEGYWGYSYNSVAAAESYPWQNPDLFAQGSLFNADKINTPLLLIHGTVDTNVPIGESIQLFNALKILGKTVEFIEVEGEDHHVMDYGKRVLWHNTMMAWFARFLQEDDRWWNDLYPKQN